MTTARFLRFTSASLAVALLLACEQPTAPSLSFPPVAVRFAPSALNLGTTYAQWWAQVEQCSGIHGDLTAVAWYTVPGSGSAVLIEGREYSGAWYAAGNRIVLAENSVFWNAGVRHEMLHALLQDGAHPPEYFRQRCADVVTCLGNACTDG
jgi:hypothetical protein